MFENLPESRRYAFFPDEVYTSDAPFDKTVGFLKYMAADPEEELSLTDEILVIELREGVFIRAKNTRWCEALTALATAPEKGFPVGKLFPANKLDDLARNYRAPAESFGDYRLLRWKVGF